MYGGPDLVVTKSGALLSLVEGRKHPWDAGDEGKGENEAWHDCLLKRSTDNGDTWSAATIIYSESAGWKGLSKGNANSTIGNCEAVADLVTGDVFVFMYVSVLYTLSGSQSQPTTFVILACALLTNDACSCWVSCFKGLTTIAELCCQNR